MTFASYTTTDASRNPGRPAGRWWFVKGGDPGADPRLRCVRSPHLCPRQFYVRPCGTWHCPAHGHRYRVWMAGELARRVRDGDVAWTTVLHLNRRCRGKAVTLAAKAVRRALARRLGHVAGARLFVVPHFAGATGDLLPYVHLHVMVVAPAESAGDLRPLLDEAAAEALHKVRQPQARIVDSTTARRIDEALAGVDVCVPLYGVTASIPSPTGVVGDDVPVVGEPAVGEVILLLVAVGRRHGLAGGVLRRRVECGVQVYREAASLGGSVVVGHPEPADPPMWVPEERDQAGPGRRHGRRQGDDAGRVLQPARRGRGPAGRRQRSGEFVDPVGGVAAVVGVVRAASAGRGPGPGRRAPRVRGSV